MIGIYMALIGFALGWVTGQTIAEDRCAAALHAQAER